MTVHLLHSSAGRHSRHGLDALGDNVRRFVLWLVPPLEEPTGHEADDPARADWHAVACALGDLAEDFFGVVAIMGILGIGAVLGIGLLYLLPWWLVGGGLIVAGIAMLGARLRQAVRRVERMVDEVCPR